MNFYEQVYAVVRRIPAGQVTSYGRIAHMLGRPRAARAVGYALNALKDAPAGLTAVPWHRVVNSSGRISLVHREVNATQQAELLRREGIPVSEHLTLDIKTYLWQGLSLWELDDIMAANPSAEPNSPFSDL
jgi:methylated-DNA-protein-cysteine methyltransferase related protein